MAFGGGWIASLSNGETVFQNDVEGEISSWQQLRTRCEEQNLYITMIRVQQGGTTLVGLPNADGYLQCYEHTRSVYTGKYTDRQGIGSVVGEFVVLCWIDKSNNVHQDIQMLKTYLPHAVMRKRQK